MRIRTMILTLLFGLLASSLSVHAQDTPVQTQQKAKERVQEQKQEQIYGSQLMTQEERNTFREKMRAAKTQEEREKIRLEHHKEMQERAKAKGVTLPDEPMQRCGAGPGHGPGAGGPMPGKCGGKKGR